jgi:hypothetical protein
MNAKQLPPFSLRMPQELRDRLERAAVESGRSVNNEIVARLLASNEPSSGLPKSVTDVVRSAAEATGKAFDDVLLLYLVVGIQSATMREAHDARLEAEEFKGMASRSLLARCAHALASSASYIGRLSRGRDAEEEQGLSIEIHSVLKDVHELERRSVTARLPRSGAQV